MNWHTLFAGDTTEYTFLMQIIYTFQKWSISCTEDRAVVLNNADACLLGMYDTSDSGWNYRHHYDNRIHNNYSLNKRSWLALGIQHL